MQCYPSETVDQSCSSDQFGSVAVLPLSTAVSIHAQAVVASVCKDGRWATGERRDLVAWENHFYMLF